MKLQINFKKTLYSFDMLLLILFFILPYNIAFYLIISLFIHELGHYIACKLLKTEVYEFKVSIFNSYIEFGNTDPKGLILISSFGPLFSIILSTVAIYFNIKELYTFNIMIVILNLIPIQSFDGHIILSNILKIIGISNHTKIINYVGIVIMILLSLYVFINYEKINLFI